MTYPSTIANKRLRKNLQPEKKLLVKELARRFLVRQWIVVLIFLIFIMKTFSLSGQVSSKGTDFWLGFMKNINFLPVNYRILITSQEAANVFVSIPGQSWYTSGTVSPNGLLVVTVPNPVTSTPNQVLNTGIRVQSSHPVSVYLTNENHISTDATLVLPVELLGDEYFVQTQGVIYPGWPAHMLIIAPQDSTIIEITPTVPLSGGIPSGVSFNVMLNEGQIYYLQSLYDMTGTKVRIANPAGCKKIAVFSGNTCATVGNCNMCDHLVAQLFPTHNWGYEFIATNFLTRSAYHLRILAKDNNTTFSINGGAGITLNAGNYHESILNAAALIQSNKPVSVAQLSQGKHCDNQDGDPAMVILPPLNQYTDSSVIHSFLTNNIASLYTNITSLAADTQHVRFNGNPVIGWNILPTKPDYAYTGFTIIAGTHTVNSISGICCMVYGFGNIESFAYISGVDIDFPEVAFQAIVGNDTLPHYSLSDSICLKTPITFFIDTLLYSHFITDVIWDMGDSHSYNGYYCTHTYQASDYYTLTMSYWNKKLCKRDSITITIHTGPGVFINPTQQAICVGDTLFLSATGADFYAWSATPNAGLMTTSGANVYAIPQLTGINPAIYSYHVTGTDTNNCEGAATAVVQVNPEAIVLTGNDTAICYQPYPLQLQGSPSGGWWTGPNVSPTGAYIPVGAGHDTLTYHYSDTNTCYGFATKIITVIQPESASFTMLPDSGCVPLTVFFQSTTGNSLWDFGDGSTSQLQNPTHTYYTTGTFQVRHHLYSTMNCVDSVIETVNVYPLPLASFSFSPTASCIAPTDVQFTNLTLGGTDFFWDFGNGQISSSAQNPSTTYSSAGSYDIMLIATNDYGCSDTAQGMFMLWQSPVADFSFQPQSGCEPLEVEFFNNSMFGLSHLWDFGNGNSSNLNNPSHHYSQPGIYSIQLITTGMGGCTDTLLLTDTLTIYPKPVADFFWDSIVPNLKSYPVQFTNISHLGGISQWDFGDKSTSSQTNPVHTFSQFGNFKVQLVESNTFGCHDTISYLITIENIKGLFVSNAFSPDYGPADIRQFKPRGTGLKTYHLQIYDAWGNLIWETNQLFDTEPAEGWDGTHNGAPLPQDVYVWKIDAVFLDGAVWPGKEYPDGNFKRFGTVTLIR